MRAPARPGARAKAAKGEAGLAGPAPWSKLLAVAGLDPAPPGTPGLVRVGARGLQWYTEDGVIRPSVQGDTHRHHSSSSTCWHASVACGAGVGGGGGGAVTC